MTFGENHKDIFDRIDQLAGTVNSSVLGRERQYVLLESQIDAAREWKAAAEPERKQAAHAEGEKETVEMKALFDFC